MKSSNTITKQARYQSKVAKQSKSKIHQCSKGFLPRLFSSFCLGFRTEAYWGKAKRGTFWPRLL